ncbi:hypothetical protein LTS07_001217 [Exophiala sideris]|uniref:Transcription factor domain-containing protein n=1 Tax=Exophiala sideris TaxID=1016849 RepID=A0ABR0JPM1_9EURO|nr:hypothetical protein LTS07_001217 [Exophiala sideris]KAK5043732.1 hypothetical protein LTR13_000086 [Exophiala sideris]KAK5067231.1 hypothetical protein LTR69_001218 [Exophiala sideris]KAK5182564.1 hypothetical protein LTR44_004955 [Eurotiomycetes sp. CCFEE 6388]
MRCEGGGGTSCQRCIKAGVACVFDRTASKRHTSAADGVAKRHRTQTLTEEIATLKAQVVSLRQSQDFRSHPVSISLEGDQPRDQSVGHSVALSPANSPPEAEGTGLPHSFTPENMGVPVTAVHAMINPPFNGEPERNAAGWTTENQSEWNRRAKSRHDRKDIIARGLIGEAEARHLFDMFMHGGNIFVPVFDPILDTFDSIRQRSAFTLTVVLYVAARHEHIHDPGNHTLQVCMEEARRLAADSLFENPSSLETTEAMAILAVHSDITWFALGHAFQMAIDLGLDKKLVSLISDSNSIPHTQKATKTMRYAFRCSRVLLVIAQYERALAFGTIRRSRVDYFAFEDMQRFLNHPSTHLSALIPCAAIDMCQRLTTLRTSMTSISMDDVERDLKAWFDKWDARLEDNFIHQESFQRSHLMLQYHYARIIMGGVLFVSTRQASQPHSPSTEQDCVKISTHILRLIRNLLMTIEDCSAFKRVFSWAPTYDGLILTFAIILGFQILQIYPDPVQENELLVQVERMATLLKQHPCQNFYLVVKRLIHRAKSPKDTSTDLLQQNPEDTQTYNTIDFATILQGEDWMFDISNNMFFDPSAGADVA